MNEKDEKQEGFIMDKQGSIADDIEPVPFVSVSSDGILVDY